jgi:hypothetical protein
LGYHQQNSSRAQVRNLLTQPIHQAANIRSKVLISYLLDKGAELDAISAGQDTPLDIISKALKDQRNQLENLTNNQTPTFNSYTARYIESTL